MIVEIINPQGKVSYQRPHNHKDVLEAFNTQGYKIRIPRDDIEILDNLPKEWDFDKIVELEESYIYLAKDTGN